MKISPCKPLPFAVVPSQGFGLHPGEPHSPTVSGPRNLLSSTALAPTLVSCCRSNPHPREHGRVPCRGLRVIASRGRSPKASCPGEAARGCPRVPRETRRRPRRCGWTTPAEAGKRRPFGFGPAWAVEHPRRGGAGEDSFGHVRSRLVPRSICGTVSPDLSTQESIRQSVANGKFSYPFRLAGWPR